MLKEMQPTCITDLIAANALYRPATIENGAVQAFLDCKSGLVAPVYFWGTYNALKETYAQMTFQEQMVQIAREVGGFSLGEGVQLVKFISKKKVEKIKAMKDKFMEGSKLTGCPYEDAVKIWDMIESGGSYLFNKCISGKEIIKQPGNLTVHDPSLTVAQMYRSFYSHKYTHYGYSLSLTESGDLKENAIKDIRYMGVKPVYRITLGNGATIDVTDNHKHPTNRGTKRTDELIPGVDSMYVVASDNRTKLSVVQSVDYIGDDDVYDVEMCDPYHTFCNSEGIVTHNSHATAYAVTAYVGTWLKANYPTAFYTVALQWADDKELAPIMAEMENCSKARVVSPDINHSADYFYTDYETDEIFWSLTRIKMLGSKAVDWIISERNKNGAFTSIENFIDRVFKYKLKKYQYWDDPDNADEAQRCPVNARHIHNLTLAGCFDKVENAKSIVERYAILQKAAERLGFKIKEKDFPAHLVSQHYFWSQQQIKVSGLGSIDYKRIYDNSDIKLRIKGKGSYMSLKETLGDEKDGRKAAICATIVDVEERKFESKKTGQTESFCKLLLQQNNDITELILWPEEYYELKEQILSSKDHIVILLAYIKYSDYTKTNALQLTKQRLIQIL